MESKTYSINGTFAKNNNMPASFNAIELRETQKAVYVYGHGTIDPQGACIRCGRTLTHPGSILLGIGPECLGDWGMRDITLENITEDQKARLTSMIQNRTVDSWIPKSVIKSTMKTEEKIEPPKDHKMLNNNQKKEEVENKATLVKYQNSGKYGIKITFKFDYAVLDKVKSLTGRKFHGDENPKYWTAPLSVDSVQSLKEWGFEIDPKLERFLKKATTKLEDVKPIEVPGLKKELFPFQKLGVSFIEAKNGRALIGDEMGLGKTAQALAWLQLRPEARPAIVVVPASLKLNWKREAEMWMEDPKVQILSGKKANVPIVGEIVIVNYDILSAWLGKLQEMKAQALIVDEIHFIKNNSAKRTKAMKALGRKIPHIIGLSGTPIVNRPAEAFNALHMIDGTIFPNFFAYARRYCDAQHNGFGWDFSGSKNTKELHEKLTGTVMLRRKKKDVLTELPDKTYSAITIEISNRKEYQRAEKDFVSWLREVKGDKAAAKAMNAEALARIEGLKQLTIKGKLKQSLEWIRDFIDIDGKLVVFATHKSTIKALMDEFGDKAVKIDGSVSQADRQNAVDRFQNDEAIRLFVGNIKAAGTGITLTASSNVVFLELPWTPGDLSQAEDRCHRIGQKNAVSIYHLLAEDSIDQEIASLIDSKRKVLDSVLDGKETSSESLLSELIAKYS